MKKLILISGHIDAGKNQLADYLQNHFERKGLLVKQDLYARDLKRFSVEDFKVLGHVIEQQVAKIQAKIGVFFDMKIGPLEAQEEINSLLYGLTFKDANFFENKTPITRTLLQIYGTDIARTRFDDDFWIKTLADRINNDNEHDIIIITDTRFLNEVENIHDYVNGRRIIPIRIERDTLQQNIINDHPSEVALDDYKFWEYIVDNNGTLHDLNDSSDIITDDILVQD